MKLSNQALGAVMMALQKSLLEQSDIVPTLKEFKFKLSDNGLMIMNPPIVKFDDDDLVREVKLIFNPEEYRKSTKPRTLNTQEGLIKILERDKKNRIK